MATYAALSRVFALEAKKVVITARDARALLVLPALGSVPTLQVNTSAASAATGVAVTAAAAGGGVALAALSSATNETMTIDAKGAGSIVIGGQSTGGVIAAATDLSVGPLGAVPALQVDASAASSNNGLLVTSAAAAGGVHLAVQSTAADEDLYVDAAGTGGIYLNTTSTGGVFMGTTGSSTRVAGTLTCDGFTDLFGGVRMPVYGPISSTASVPIDTSGTTYPISNPTGASMTITLPAVGEFAGGKLSFVLTATSAFTISFVLPGNPAFFYGVIAQQGGNVTQIITKQIVRFAATARVGDTIDFTGVADTMVTVKAFSSVAAGITAL